MSARREAPRGDQVKLVALVRGRELGIPARAVCPHPAAVPRHLRTGGLLLGDLPVLHRGGNGPRSHLI